MRNDTVQWYSVMSMPVTLSLDDIVFWLMTNDKNAWAEPHQGGR